MPKFEIPQEWNLSTNRRYIRQNMERAMRGKIDRGLVELITNSDGSYQDLEDLEEKRGKILGKIRIEIERRKKGQPSIVKVRDRAGGMNRMEMYEKLGELGKRTSGFERGKMRRGLHGRGARDVAVFGTVHFESIKDEEYNHLIIPPSLKCRFTEPKPKKATEEIRKKLGIPRGNGTVVTIGVEGRFEVPQHQTLLYEFSRYYSLREIFSNPDREVKLVDLNKNREDPLSYPYRHRPGEEIFNESFSVPKYPEATAHLMIYKHISSFEQGILPSREGILIKSGAAIHDCTYFGLESEPFSWRFTGELCCKFIDNLIREYDDREEANPDNPNHPEDNPIRLLDPFRDGLILEHPFAQELYKRGKEILRPFIEELKSAEAHPKQNVTNEDLERKLDNLSKEVSRVFERKLIEIEKEIPTGDIADQTIISRPNGLHIIPLSEKEEISILVDQPKTFSIIVKHYEDLDESLPIDIKSSDPDNIRVRTSPVFLKKFSEDKKVGRATFTVEGSKIGAEAFIEVRYNGYDKLMLVKVIEASPPAEVPEGFSFEKPLYHLQLGKEKTLTLQLKTATKKLDNQIPVEITSDHPEEIVVKGGGRYLLRETDILGVLVGNCRIIGRQLKVKGIITARVKGFEPAHTSVIVEERSPRSGINLKSKPIDDDFGVLRYKWDDKEPYLLLIAARHPSIERYLGELTEQGYPGINDPRYHIILAEIIAEALAFRILEKQFPKEGVEGRLDYTSTDAYYHKHFSEFLAITHKHLVTV
ncbi:MAG: hypothetical protein AB1422_16550 [bacterium]